MMKNKYILPFAFSTFVLALAGCGGESSNIPLEPEEGVVTTSSSCKVADESCLQFALDYPVAGLNFDCSGDTTHHFATTQVSNSTSGACKVGDKAKFYIQGLSDKKIDLGTVDLNTISTRKIAEFSTLSLVDLATAMTGKTVQSMSMSDPTFNTLVGLVRLFQSIGVQQNTNMVGDIQPIELTQDFKNKMIAMKSSVNVQNFTNGTYVNLLKPWVDVTQVTEAQAIQVAQNLVNMGSVASYQADFMPFMLSSPNSSVKDYIEGFHGKSGLNKETMANLYMLTDRSGYTFGYGMQWTGPVKTGANINPALARLTLLVETAPLKMMAKPQKNWINPFTKAIDSTQPFHLTTSDNTADDLKIYQGKLINNYSVAGTEAVYKQIMKTDKGDSSAYGKWTQIKGAEQFDGTIDFTRSNTVSYLDKKVFLSKNNVKTGESYIFPLYATLNFKFTDTTESDVKLGIVIDENGDIRTDIGPNATENDLSGKCGSVDANYRDENQVQQYRIGTSGAASVGETDKSVTLRMILADPIFKRLEGVIIGLNQTINVTDGLDETTAQNVSGVKINIHNLITDKNTSKGINITDFVNKDARWANIYAAYQRIYINTEVGKKNATQIQKDAAKRTSGTLSISLPACYSVQVKR